MAEVFGTRGNDLIRGTGRSDAIYGGFDAGWGSDSSVVGGQTVYGDDTILGGNGNDFIDGFGGKDRVYGGAGDDTLNGGIINDGKGDLLDGGAGNDEIGAAFWGSTTMRGGDGDDRFGELVYAGAHVVDGGSGYDRFWMDIRGDADLRFTLGGPGVTSVFYGEGSRILNIEEMFIFAGDGNDVITLGAGDDEIHANGGNDRLHVGAGNDFVSGGDGNDTLLGGAGADHLHGDAGNDVVDLGREADEGWNWATGGGGDDTILGSGWDDLLMGGGGHDLMVAGAGNDDIEDDDWVFSDFGNDTIRAGDGDDRVQSFGGTDSLDGGAGFDELGFYREDAIASLNFTVREGGARSTVLGDATTFVGFETYSVTTGAGDDTIAGGGETDWLQGRGGADRIFGHGGADELRGEDGNDRLYGEAGEDDLYGGAGRDLLEGGLGNDDLIGGADQDIFRFLSAGEGGDRIEDYARGEDRIQVSASGFGQGLVAGTSLAATGQFVANATGEATSADGVGQFIWWTLWGELLWDADGAGAGEATVLTGISGTSLLTASDIAVIA